MNSKGSEVTMKRIIRILLTLTGMAWATVSFAQNPTVTYYYDDCGNRIERTLGFKKVEENGRSLATDDVTGWLAKAEDNFYGVPVLLYPNPTDGKFSLAFLEEVPQAAHAELCSTNGVVIDSRSVKNPVEEFDLTGKSAGIYVLRLTSGKETQTWKIIKKD